MCRFLKGAANEIRYAVQRNEVQHDRADDFKHVKANAQNSGDGCPGGTGNGAGKHDERQGEKARNVREHEGRARGLGVHTMRVKLAAFVISAVPTGLVGALWFFFIGQVLPQYGFDPLFDLSVALMAFFGGFGTLWGPILGALLLEPGEQYLTLRVSNSYVTELAWGTLFLLVILFISRGVVPIAGEKMTAWRARRQRRMAGYPAAGEADTANVALPEAAEQPSAPSGRPAR